MGSIIGVDEAGRGPVIGPLVVAGLKLSSSEQAEQLTELGVRDSKKCSPQKRERLSTLLKAKFSFTLKVISATEIDERRKEHTLNELEGEWFSEVINQLSPDSDTTIIVDSADANEKTFQRYIQSRVTASTKIISRHKADEQYPAVAAASIIAKYERDTQIEKIAKQLNYHFGSGYPSDPITVKFLEKWIKEKGNLPPHTRYSWITAQRLLKKYGLRGTEKTLDQY